MLVHEPGLVAELPADRLSECESPARPTWNDSLPDEIAAPRESSQPLAPCSKLPPGTGVYELKSPQGANGWDSAWLPQLPGRIESRFACAAGAARAPTASVDTAASKMARGRRIICYLPSLVRFHP